MTINTVTTTITDISLAKLTPPALPTSGVQELV